MSARLPDLWKRIQKDDTSAWRDLVAEYADLVYAVARKAGLSRPDAEDCVQATWLALYRSRRALRDAQALPAWLIRTTRRNAVRLAASRADRPLATTLEPSEAATQEREAELSEFRAHLPLAFKALDPRCRELLERLYLDSESSSYAELARALGLRADSVGALRARCLVRLGKILEKMGWELH